MDSPSFLVIIIDIDSLLHSTLFDLLDKKPIDINNIINSIIVFCNAYCLMNRWNKLVVIVNTTAGPVQAYPCMTDTTVSPSFTPALHELGLSLSKAFWDIIRYPKTSNGDGDQSDTSEKRYLSMCFSTALTLINKQKINSSGLQSRILVVQFDKDKALNYNSLMNSIFSCQKLDVKIDAHVCSTHDSHFLQQACFLTSGFYLKHQDVSDLLQTLSWHFLSDSKTRSMLSASLQDSVDFKASCSFHKKPVDYAFMCSVCLTLTCADCEASDQCMVCFTPKRVLS